MIRDLFHELSSEAFGILKSIGVEAVRQAQPTHPQRSSFVAARDAYCIALHQSLGAERVIIDRSAMTTDVIISMRWPCRRWTEAVVSEQAMVADPVGAWPAVRAAAERAVHRCDDSCRSRSGLPTGRREPSDPT